MKDWPELIAFNYPHEAHLVKGYLESNGVETILKDELTTQVVNIYSSAIGGVKLLVRESDYGQGIQLLKDGGYIIEEDAKVVNKVEIVPLDKTANKKVCPFCGSENLSVFKKHDGLSAVLFVIINMIVMIGAISPLFKSSFKCFDCGKEWKYKRT